MTDILSDFNWLAQLEPSCAAAVRSKMHSRQLSTGEVAYRYGDQADNIYQIISGHIQASHVDENGREILFHIMAPGDCFGELGVIENAPRVQTMTARAPSQLAVLTSADYLQLSTQYPQIDKVLLRLQCRRLRLAFSMVESISLGSLHHKLIKRLQSLAQLHGKTQENGNKIAINISQEELGNMLGATRQSINRELGTLQQQGSISLENGFIVIHDTLVF